VRTAARRSDETGIWEDTYRVLRRDGEIRWLHSFGRRTSAPGVVPEIWHGIAVDVTAMRASSGDVTSDMTSGDATSERGS
jgi:hypothetical protein